MSRIRRLNPEIPVGSEHPDFILMPTDQMDSFLGPSQNAVILIRCYETHECSASCC